MNRPALRGRLWRVTALALVVAGAAPSPLGRAATEVSADYWPTRDGVAARVLMIRPEGSKRGVILLPGGHGNINLDAQGTIGWGQDDFLVRTRSRFAAAGFTVAIPDVATDHKPPAALGDYRASEQQAYDLRAISGRLRRIVDRVWMIGFDQGALSALNTVAKDRADLVAGVVLVSPVLDFAKGEQDVPNVSNAQFAAVPMLVIRDERDACSAPAVARLDRLARASAAPNYVSLAASGNRDEKLPGHLSYYEDPCNRTPAHALVGLEAQVTTIIIDWMRAQDPACP